MTARLLLAVDDTPASEKATEYVSEWIGDAASVFVRVLHVLPPLPKEVREPVAGARTQPAHLVAQKREQWTSEAEARARPRLDRATERLLARGEERVEVDCGFLACPTDGSLADGLLGAAREHACETIVVGRNTMPWYGDDFRLHVSDELVKKAKGFTVWVVEGADEDGARKG